ncbi:MAG: PTS fructose transporter subunit IIA [Gammaproteobacteria bacterium]|nr:PTS fructose transporter subunit IIA [Gammaproteobacteria bacterium]
MSVGLLIITHNNIGQQLLETVTAMLGTCPLKTDHYAIHNDCNLEDARTEASSRIANLDSGDGVIILTDMYGSTPSNVANHLSKEYNIRVISGVNLPMLIRVLNYPRLNLNQLAEKARSGGKDGIMICKPLC